MRKSDMVSRGTQSVDAPRQRRDCQYPALAAPAGSCPVCLGTLPCPCAQAYGAALYRCAGSACPGLPYRASDCSHPFACSTIADVRAITRDADAEIGRTYGDPATLTVREYEALECACDTAQCDPHQAHCPLSWSARDARAHLAATLPKFAALGQLARPLRVNASGVLVEFAPFDGREPDKCAVCDGHGGELEPDQDGYCVGKWCRTCGGTGERKYCGECLDALPKGGEPEQKHEAVFELRVDAGVRDVTRLVCEEPEHLGCALRDVVDMARRVRAQHDEARAAEQRMRAAIEADASKEPLP